MRDLESLRKALAEFAQARNWDQYHSPKNLVMALSVEVAELLEHFQWLGEEEARHLDAETLAKVADEIADVQIYLVRIADKLEIDILEAAEKKLVKNAEKYPAGKAHGSARKYTQLE